MAIQHNSYFYSHKKKEYDFPILTDFNLSPEVSEWLSYSKFWDHVNNKYGTIFQLYEDDTINYKLLPKIINDLKNKLELSKKDKNQIKFCYAWSDKGEEFHMNLEKRKLLKELEELISFLKDCHKNNYFVTFSL